MSTDAVYVVDNPPEGERLRRARQIVRHEAAALAELATRLDASFSAAITCLQRCAGSVIVTGMGKAGWIGQKISATLASTGTRSHFLHPAEAIHGDLGRVHLDDAVLALSNSGETEEIVRLLPSFRKLGMDLVAITASRASSLGRAATVTLELGALEEACPLRLAPSTSTTAMLALGDALALVLSGERDFRREDFNRNHPGGALGRQTGPVDEHMRPLAECRVAAEGQSVREVYVALGRPGRRSGAIAIVDAAGRLSGIFTDSDLARLFERRRDESLDRPIGEVMTRRPRAVVLGTSIGEAVEILSRHKISELPVVDDQGRPAGLIDITDLVGIVGNEPADGALDACTGAARIPPPKLLKLRESLERDRP